MSINSFYSRLSVLFIIVFFVFIHKSGKVQQLLNENILKEKQLSSKSSNTVSKTLEDSVNLNGGWKNKKCPFQPPEEHNKNGGYFYTREEILRRHRLFDQGFGRALIKFLENQTVVDIGAGVGQFGYFLKQNNARVQWAGFDGGNNIQEFWGKNYALGGDKHYVIPEVCWMDASVPVQLNETFDWTISAEVGEHIDKKFESNFLDNLVSFCRKGVILTWAVKGQGGFHHINNQNNDYIINEMKKRNMIYDEKQAQSFRDAVTTLGYLRNTAMVFRKAPT